MSEDTSAVFDDLKAQARGQASDGLREFEEVEDTEAPEPTTTPADDSELEADSPTSPEEDDTADYGVLLERLRAAEKARDTQAGRAGDLKHRNEQLEQRLAALEANSQQSPQAEQQGGYVPLRAQEQDVEAFARGLEGQGFDDAWEDSYKRDMYNVSYNVGLNLADGFGREIGALKAELGDLRFDRELTSAGMDRPTFDGIVAELPQLQGMEPKDQLATIVRLGRSFGSGSQPSVNHGAPTTQRPRIETPMGGGSAMDSRAKTLRQLEEAHDSGDRKRIAKVSGSIFDHWKAQNGLA